MAQYRGVDGLLNTPFEVVFEPESGNMSAPVIVVSHPPPGSHRIVNIYMSPAGKLVVQHSDQPA